MAVLAGILVVGAIQAQQPTRSTDLDGGGAPSGGAVLASLAVCGSPNVVAPHPEEQAALTGSETIATHLWERVVLSPSTKALGLVASLQTFPVEVWNTHRRTQWLLTSTVIGGLGGLELSGVVLAAQLSPLGSRVFTATVPDSGVATIANTATFTVVQDRNGGLEVFHPVLTVTGLRITPFPFAPDWSRPIRERVEYKTAVLTSRNGMEQRARLRKIPRRGLEYEISLPHGRKLDSLLWKRQGETFGVPWWPDGVRYSGTLSAGAVTISGDFSNRLFPCSNMVMVWESPDRCEIQTVNSASDNTISMSALGASYTNPLILPVFVGRIDPSQDLSRVTSRFTQARVRFACEVGPSDPEPPVLSYTPTYGSYLLTTPPDWQGAQQNTRRILSRFDAGTGPITVSDLGDLSFQSQDFRWFLNGRAQAQAFRLFVNTMGGSQRPFWVPTWRQDLVLSQPAASNASGITVQACGYATRMFADDARRYLAIRNPSGGWIYRKALSASEIGNEETITLDAQNGVALPVGTSVSFLTLCRLSDDTQEIEWSTTEFGQATSRFVELPREVPA